VSEETPTGATWATVRDGAIVWPDVQAWTITPALRWRDGVLEQCWQGDKGGQRWEAVPTVEGDGHD